MAETEETPNDTSPPSPGGDNQRKRILSAARWLAVGEVFSQALAFFSSVILTRFLTTEIYGVMELVYVTYTGLHMFSDLGLAQNIIHSKRGDEPRFLNTAWTAQILRGTVLFMATWILGPLIAFTDGTSDYVLLIPAVGLTALIEGSESMAMHTESRHLSLQRITMIRIASRLLMVVVQVLVAMAWPSPWALVFGSWTAAVTITASSHLFLKSHSHRFDWDPTAVRELLRFGGWIFGSTVMTFFYNQGDRLILNAFVTKSQLGVYGIAMRFRGFFQQIQGKLVRQILMPVLAERSRWLSDWDDDARMAEVSRVYYRARLLIDAVFVTGAGVLMAFGYTLVTVIYPPDFHPAGRILQVVSLQIAMMAALGSTEAILTGLGHTKHFFLQSIGRTLMAGIGMPLGYYVAGFWGIVWAVALIEVPTVFILLWQMAKLRLLRVQRELLAFVFLALGVGIGTALSYAVEYIVGLIGLGR